MAQITPLGILKGARKRISDQEHWAQNDLAVNNYGHEVPVNSKDAVAWCAIGSVYRSGKYAGESVLREPPPVRDARAFLTAAVGELFNTNDITDVNDGAFIQQESAEAHTQILSVFDRAIALAKADR